MDDGAKVTVLSPDRLGLLADVAALFATQRASVRAARAWNQGEVAVSVWDVADAHLDAAVLRQRFEAIAAGRLDPSARLRRTIGDGIAPTVSVRADASLQATVLEVRAADRTGALYLVCAALAAEGVSVRSAHVDTLGPQAVDVFYVQEESAGALSDPRASQAAHAVREALSGIVPDVSVRPHGVSRGRTSGTIPTGGRSARRMRIARGVPSGWVSNRMGSLSSSSGVGVTGPECSISLSASLARASPGLKTSISPPNMSPTCPSPSRPPGRSRLGAGRRR